MATTSRPYRGIAGFNVDEPPPWHKPAPDRSLRENLELITDLARFSEALLSESAVRRKWRLSEETWELLGADDELVRAIEEEKTRRIRSGATKRELAQHHVIRGPSVLAGIMDDPKANARHRVDSIKALDAIADPGPEAAAEQERIVIRIDLSADTKDPKDVLEFEATVPPKPNPPIDSWDAPKQLENVPFKRKDDDGDNDF